MSGHTRLATQWSILSALTLASLQTMAGTIYYPPASEDPVMDGQFTTPGEDANAVKELDDLGVGYFYKQYIQNWTVNSVEYANSLTLFNTHAFSNAAYGQLDTYDLNSFSVKYGDHTIKTWVFLAGDESDDAGWLNAVGIGASSYPTGLNDDGGFLVRLDGDPSTDRIWHVGDAKPGDASWNFADYYGVFAYGGFNNSAYLQGYDASTTSPREIYEWSLTLNQDGTGGIFGGGGGPGNPPPPLQPCDPIWDLRITYHEVDDWKPSMGGWGTIGGLGHVPDGVEWVLMGFDASMHPIPAVIPQVPEPGATTLTLAGFVAMMMLARRRSAASRDIAHPRSGGARLNITLL